MDSDQEKEALFPVDKKTESPETDERDAKNENLGRHHNKNETKIDMENVEKEVIEPHNISKEYEFVEDVSTIQEGNVVNANEDCKKETGQTFDNNLYDPTSSKSNNQNVVTMEISTEGKFIACLFLLAHRD